MKGPMNFKARRKNKQCIEVVKAAAIARTFSKNTTKLDNEHNILSGNINKISKKEVLWINFPGNVF